MENRRQRLRNSNADHIAEAIDQMALENARRPRGYPTIRRNNQAADANQQAPAREEDRQQGTIDRGPMHRHIIRRNNGVALPPRATVPIAPPQIQQPDPVAPPQNLQAPQDPVYSVDQLLKAGLEFVGFTEKRQNRVKKERNEERFRGNFGVSPVTISKVVIDLLEENRIRDFKLKYFFLMLFWLKAYPTYPQLEGPWNLSPETIAPKLKVYISALQHLKAKKIKWFGDNEILDHTFIISVDGVHCRIQEVRRDPNSSWYSHKSNGAALAYELAIAIRSNRLVWINGPFPASRHDITIFRYGNGTKANPGRSLMAMIPDGKRAIGDSGYGGEPLKVSVTRHDDSEEVKEFKARAKSRHETFNSRIKSFEVLAREFRHNDNNFHQAVMESVCVLVQYDLENGHPLFEV